MATQPFAKYLVEQANATDHDVIQLKHELTILLDIINNPNWPEQGWGLFSNHVPRGVRMVISI